MKINYYTIHLNRSGKPETDRNQFDNGLNGFFIWKLYERS